MKLVYPAIVHNEADGLWIDFPDLVGCTSTGDTISDLLTNAEEAMSLYILGALEDGERLPDPSAMQELTYEADCYPTLIQADIDLAKNTKSIKKTLTIPAWLNERALEKNLNFSKILQEALIEKAM